jgi:hypothetical protein
MKKLYLAILLMLVCSFVYAEVPKSVSMLDASVETSPKVISLIDAGVKIDDAGIHAPLEINETEEVPPQVVASINYVKTGEWLLFAVALIQLLVFLCKKFGKALWGRWNSTIVLSLSGVAGILFYVFAGNWCEAAILGLSGLAPMLIHDVTKNIKNKTKTAVPKVDSEEPKK